MGCINTKIKIKSLASSDANAEQIASSSFASAADSVIAYQESVNCIVCATWMKAWHDYSLTIRPPGQTLQTHAARRKGYMGSLQSPGHISNTKLLQPNNHRKFAIGRKLGQDYRVVTEEIWDLIEQIYGGGPPITVPGTVDLNAIQLERHGTIHPFRNQAIANHQLYQIRQDDLLSRARSKDNNVVSICVDLDSVVSNSPSSDSESTVTFSANGGEFASPSKHRSLATASPTSLSESSDRRRSASAGTALVRINSEGSNAGRMSTPLKMKSLSVDGEALSMNGSEDTGSMFSDLDLTPCRSEDGSVASSSVTGGSVRDLDVGGVRATVERYERRREGRPSLAAKRMKSGMQTTFVVKVCVGDKSWKLHKRYKDFAALYVDVKKELRRLNFPTKEPGIQTDEKLAKRTRNLNAFLIAVVGTDKLTSATQQKLADFLQFNENGIPASELHWALPI